MSPGSMHRADVERALAAAQRRARDLVPYSPAWDALMGYVEELERSLWRLDVGEAGIVATAHAPTGPRVLVEG
jgi:hypothetical protein